MFLISRYFSEGFRENGDTDRGKIRHTGEATDPGAYESCKVSDPNGLRDDFEYFKNMGINMALDDFGTEYSSIALLRKLKPQWIKIDHTFVRSIQDDEMDQAILEYIMNLSKQTRIKVCVEGVENEEILSVVQTYKPELLQGYYYSRPCSAEEFSKKYFNGKDKTGSYGCLKK